MFDKSDVFLDVFAHKKNLATGIEARIKIIFTVIALVINLLSTNIYAPMSIAGLCLITLLLIEVPPKLILLRLTMPLVLAVIVLVTQIFFYGTSSLFILPFWGLHLVGYKEGLAQGLIIMWRVIAGVLLILFLTMSTPAHKLFLAASWFKAPRILVELTLLIYRYIFVLAEEAVTIKDAQKVRLGYRKWSPGMKSLGILGSSLILRAYDRAERVFAAMLVRGYTGTININYKPVFGKRDYLIASCLGLTLATFYLIGQIKG